MQWHTQERMGGPEPLFLNIILDFCINVRKFLKGGAFPRICESLTGVVLNYFRDYTPRLPTDII